MMNAYWNVSVSLDREKDADIVEQMLTLDWGQRAAWIKKAIREKLEREE